MRVLIVEDEVNLALPLIQILKKNNITSEAVHDGLSGLMLARKNIYDVIILDIMLPEIDGLSVLKTLREEGNSTPILLLTAKDDIDDRVKGLEMGSDDYLTKPFNTKELIARIKALLRRSNQKIIDQIIEVEDISLDLNNAVLMIGETKEILTKKEADLLYLLMQNKNKIIKKEYILDKVWGADSESTPNSVEIYIHHLRKKIIVSKKLRIITSRGIGYSLKMK